jgi:hypothetical protein
VAIGQAVLNDHVLAVADEVEVSPTYQYGPGPQYGIVGLSFAAQEASVCASAPRSCDVNFTTPTVLDALFDAGYIRSRAYSLYLDDVDSSTGSILFGGIDTAKFSGELTTLSIQKDTHDSSWTKGLYVNQALSLTSVSSSFNGKTEKYTPKDYSSTVVLDSGAGSLSLPPQIYDHVVLSAPVILRHDGSAAMRCKDANTDDHLTIGLTGTDGVSATIDIPLSNMVVPIYQGPYNHPKPFTYRGDELCVFAVARGGETDNLLGDPLLRSAYTVFNLDEKTVSIAKASYNSKASDVRTIQPGAVPPWKGTGSDGVG